MKPSIYLDYHRLLPRWLEYAIAVIFTEEEVPTSRHYQLSKSRIKSTIKNAVDTTISNLST